MRKDVNLKSGPSGGLDRLARGRARRSVRAGRCGEEKPVACSRRSNSPPCEHFFPVHGARGTRTTDRLVRFAHSDARAQLTVSEGEVIRKGSAIDRAVSCWRLR